MGCAASIKIKPVQPEDLASRDFYQQYHVRQLIGSGSFGSVFIANHKASGEDYAVKVVRFSKRNAANDSTSAATEESFRREHQVWARVKSHLNVVSLVEWHVDSKFGYLVMDLCQSSLLKAWTNEYDLNEYIYATYFEDMAHSLRHIHALGIVHRDVKQDNFLVDGHTTRRVKLCDFGLSTTLQDHSRLAAACGSVPYMAPEVVKAETRSGTAADVWSLGVIVYMSFFGRWPYHTEELSRTVMTEAIRTGNTKPNFRPSRRFTQGVVSDVAMKFVKSLLVREPLCRCSAEDCLQFDYLRIQGIRAGAVATHDLDRISLKQAMQEAIKYGAFGAYDEQKAADTATAVMEQQEKFQRMLAANDGHEQSSFKYVANQELPTIPEEERLDDMPGVDNKLDLADDFGCTHSPPHN